MNKHSGRRQATASSFTGERGPRFLLPPCNFAMTIGVISARQATVKVQYGRRGDLLVMSHDWQSVLDLERRLSPEVQNWAFTELQECFLDEWVSRVNWSLGPGLERYGPPVAAARESGPTPAVPLSTLPPGSLQSQPKLPLPDGEPRPF